MNGPVPALVFLHLPKTAGQTVHLRLADALGEAQVSPIRLHTQAPPEAQFPPGYRLYSGHLDWVALDRLPGPHFVFTLLRDPRERLASFYFYLQDTARRMPPEQRASQGRADLESILTRTPDEYFFGGDAGWQGFVRDHYDNFYCSYFASRRILGRPDLAGLDAATVLARAKAGLGAMDAVYRCEALHVLDRDFARKFGLRLSTARHVANQGTLPRGAVRWRALLDRFETDAGRARIEGFVTQDEALMAVLPPPPPRPLWLQLLDRISR